MAGHGGPVKPPSSLCRRSALSSGHGRLTPGCVLASSGPPGARQDDALRPAAGRTALGFALLSKDDIKEPLFDSLGGVRGDREATQRIGAAAWEVLWALAPHIPRLVLEANFHVNSAYEHARLVALPGRIVEVYCRCPPAEVARRFAATRRAARRRITARRHWYAGDDPQSVIVLRVRPRHGHRQRDRSWIRHAAVARTAGGP